MTVPTFYLKLGATLPTLRATLRNGDGSVMNLTGATVKLRLRPAGGAVKVNAAATVIDPNGVVDYAWGAGDSDTEGLFDAEWWVTRGGGLEIVPGNGFFKVLIGPHL